MVDVFRQRRMTSSDCGHCRQAGACITSDQTPHGFLDSRSEMRTHRYQAQSGCNRRSISGNSCILFVGINFLAAFLFPIAIAWSNFVHASNSVVVATKRLDEPQHRGAVPAWQLDTVGNAFPPGRAL